MPRKPKKKTARKPRQVKPPTREQAIREMRASHSLASHPSTPEPIRPPINKVKEKKLAALFEKLKKKYKGEEVVTTIASGARSSSTISVIPTGASALDDLLTGETDADARTIAGSGLGWPRGRIIEIFGEESTGKTSMSLQAIAAFQAAGEEAAFVDAEHALDIHYAKKLQVDLNRLKLIQPDDGGERAMDVVTALVSSGLFGIIVVDSVSALTPQSEIDADFEDSVQPARQAALMSRALRKLASLVAKNDVLLIFINQIRIKLGVRFGNPKTTSGGQALKFYASVRLELTNMKTQRKGDRVIGRRMRVRTVKNKVAPPFRDVYADLMPNKGYAQFYADPDLGGKAGDDE